SRITVQEGEPVTLSLLADAPAGLGAWTADVRYNPLLLQPVSCDAGGMAVCNAGYARGVVRFSGASAAGDTSLTLGRLTFNVIGPGGGVSFLALQARALVDGAGAP